MIRLEVPLGSRSYPVVVGESALSEFQSLLPSEVSRVAFVTQEGIDASIATELPSSVHYLPDGEQAKRLAVIEDLCGAFA
ncbi:MAG: 3-dehydroquinate synthase, partial [Actinomycetota bacterium]|nr:3-dehydroquinate synthase [Actinomycetota bacterium]